MRNHCKPWFREQPPAFTNRTWWNRTERLLWIRQDRLLRREREQEEILEACFDDTQSAEIEIKRITNAISKIGVEDD